VLTALRLGHRSFSFELMRRLLGPTCAWIITNAHSADVHKWPELCLCSHVGLLPEELSAVLILSKFSAAPRARAVTNQVADDPNIVVSTTDERVLFWKGGYGKSVDPKGTRNIKWLALFDRRPAWAPKHINDSGISDDEDVSIIDSLEQ